MRRLRGHAAPASEEGPEAVRIEALAVHAVTETERRLGSEPRDVRALKCSYDITATKNEILMAINKPDDFSLAVVLVDGDRAEVPQYVVRPFTRGPGFGVTGVNYALQELRRRATGLILLA